MERFRKSSISINPDTSKGTVLKELMGVRKNDANQTVTGLRSVDKDKVRDSSAPVLDPKINLRSGASGPSESRNLLMAAIGGGSGGMKLKKGPKTEDRSVPVLDSNVVVKKYDRNAQLEEIEEGKSLKNAKNIADRSAPRLPSAASPAIISEVLKGVEGKKVELRKVEEKEQSDRSVPQIESGVKVKKVDRKTFLGDVVKHKPSLREVQTKDKSKPVIESGLKVRKTDRKKFLSEITLGKDLRKIAMEKTRAQSLVVWINSVLRKSGPGIMVSNLFSGLDSGVVLIRLVNSLFGIKIPEFIGKPIRRIDMSDNLQKAIDMIAKTPVADNLKSLGFEVTPDIFLKRKERPILAVVWMLCYEYQIRNMGVEPGMSTEKGGSDGLLNWVKNILSKEKLLGSVLSEDELKTKRFSSEGFINGRAFCALLSHFYPEDFDIKTLKKENVAENVGLALSFCEKKFGMVPLFKVADFVEGPDDLTVILFVSELFHHLEITGQKGNAAKCINRCVEFVSSTDTMKQTYIESATKLVSWIKRKIAEFARDVPIIVNNDHLTEFRSYKRREKPLWAARKDDIFVIFNQLRTKLCLYERPEFKPSDEISPGNIETLWATLAVAEVDCGEKLKKGMSNVQALNGLLRDWDIKARKFSHKLDGICNEADFLVIESYGANSVEEVEKISQELKTIEKSFNECKPDFVALGALAKDIRSKGRNEGLKSKLNVNNIVEIWKKTTDFLKVKTKDLDLELSKQQLNEKMRQEFAKSANQLNSLIKSSQTAVDTCAKLSELKTIQKGLLGISINLKTAVVLNQKLEEREIADVSLHDFSIEELSMAWDHLNSVLVGKIKSLGHEYAKKSETQISADLACDFYNSFVHFDRSDSGSLTLAEFSACLRTVGHYVSEEKMVKLLKEVNSNFKDSVDFETFVKFMINRTKYIDSVQQLKDAFVDISGGKSYVSTSDLNSVFSGEVLSYLLEHLTRTSEGLDFLAWIKNSYQ